MAGTSWKRFVTFSTHPGHSGLKHPSNMIWRHKYGRTALSLWAGLLNSVKVCFFDCLFVDPLVKLLGIVELRLDRVAVEDATL